MKSRVLAFVAVLVVGCIFIFGLGKRMSPPLGAEAQIALDQQGSKTQQRRREVDGSPGAQAKLPPVWRGLGKCPALDDPVVAVHRLAQNRAADAVGATIGDRRNVAHSAVYSVKTADGSSYMAKLHGPGIKYSGRSPLEAWHEVFASQLANVLGIGNSYCNRGTRLDVDHQLRFRCRGLVACARVDPAVVTVFRDASGQQYVFAAALAVIEAWSTHNDTVRVFDKETTGLLLGGAAVPTHAVQKVRDASSILVLDFILDNHDKQFLTVRGPGGDDSQYIQIDKGRAWTDLERGMCSLLDREKEAKGMVSALALRRFDWVPVEIELRRELWYINKAAGALCTYPRALVLKLADHQGLSGIMHELSSTMQADPLLSLPVLQYMVEHSRVGGYWQTAGAKDGTGQGGELLLGNLGMFEACIATQLLLTTSAIEACRSKGTLRLV
jgi:hypothetical protein